MKIISLKFKVVSDNDKNVDIDINDEHWMLDREPSDSFTNFVHVDIFGKVNNSRKYIHIGIISGRYFKVGEALNQQASLFDIFDSIDQDTHLVYCELLDKEGNINDDFCGLKLNIFHIERFYIEEQFRNQGIGEKVLDLLDDILNYTLNCEVGCYILLANPIAKNDKNQLKIIEDENLNKKLKKKLVRFYRKCGYKKINKSDYMYLNTDYISVKRDFDVL